MAKKITVHILSEVGGAYAKHGLIGMLSSKRPDVEFKDIKLDETGKNFKSQSDKDEIQTATILLTDPGLIAKLNLAQLLPNLKWMQSTWAGVDSLVKSLDQDKPLPSYQLTRFAGVFGPHMAEYVVGHIIYRERKFQEMKARQIERKWATKEFDHYRLLSDLRLGILGCGDIGGEIAKAAKVFGMQVWGIGKRDLPKERRSPHVDRYMLIPQLSEMLKNCDYVCNVLPSTPETRGLLSGDVLSKCENRKSVFINVGRGDVIDESSLIKAVSSGWISHAILDVLKEEPPSEDSALWLHPNVTISPHVAGVSLPSQVVELFLDNFDRYMTDKPLKFVVDFEEGY